jgi:hypothetical protein
MTRREQWPWRADRAWRPGWSKSATAREVVEAVDVLRMKKKGSIRTLQLKAVLCSRKNTKLMSSRSSRKLQETSSPELGLTSPVEPRAEPHVEIEYSPPEQHKQQAGGPWFRVRDGPPLGGWGKHCVGLGVDRPLGQAAFTLTTSEAGNHTWMIFPIPRARGDDGDKIGKKGSRRMEARSSLSARYAARFLPRHCP